MKTFYVLSSILNIISSFYGLVLFALNAGKSLTNKVFTAFTLFVFLWSVFYYLFTTTNDQNSALLFMRIGVGFAIFIAPTFFHFVTCLIGRPRQYSRLSILFYLYGAALYGTAFTPLFIPAAQPLGVITYFPLAGPSYVFLILGYFLISGYGLYLIYSETNNHLLSRRKRRELKWVFWGILIAYLGGATDYPQNYHIPIHPVGNCFVSLYMLFITFSILKYQSFDIRFIYKKSLVYTSLIAVITLIYLALTLVMENQFRERLGYTSFFLSFAVAILIGLLFIPLKNMLERIVFKHSLAQILLENDSLRQEVIQTERLRSIATLASGMAHEIKNPLTALKTFSEYLPQKLTDVEFLKKFTPILQGEVGRIDALVHNLLDFAKPVPVELKPANIHDVLDSSIDILHSHLVKHRIVVQKQYGIAESILLPLDRQQLKQAILNIVLNAIDAMPQSGSLYISTEMTAQMKARIVLRDSGKGIAAGDLPHIFDPFFSKKDHGTGLGLSITHEIIKNHRGKIFVESTLGEGTTFTIELPTIPPSGTTPTGH